MNKNAMTKKKFLELIDQFNDDDEIVIHVHDATIYEDLYDFNIESVEIDSNKKEIRLLVLK